MTNAAIFPASLLPLSDELGRLSHSLPAGSYLIVLPPGPSPTWDSLFGLAAAVEEQNVAVDLMGPEELVFGISSLAGAE